MPVQKFSAMDPSGSWNMDARDQTAMWNADRGDRINMWQQNRVDQRGQDDWRKEVALKQLGLTEKGMDWNREDTAAERAAKYGFMGQELGLRQQESAADRALRERGFGLQERAANMQFSEADRLAKQREAEDAGIENFDYSTLGLDANTAAAVKALPIGLRKSFLPQAAMRGVERAFKPQDRQDAAEQASINQSLALIQELEGQTNLNPRQMNAYKAAKAQAAASGVDSGLGLETKATDPVRAAQEKIDAVSRKAEELAGGVTGYASESDINELSDMVASLKRDLQDIGYTDEQIQPVLAELEKKISRTGGAPGWQRVMTSMAGGPVGLAANIFGVGAGINPEERARIIGGQR